MADTPKAIRFLAQTMGFHVSHRPIRNRGRLHHSRSPWLLYLPNGYKPPVYVTAFATAAQLQRYLQRRFDNHDYP